MNKFIRITTALAVATVAAVISYRHAYELVSTHGEMESPQDSSPSRSTA
jgi:hypothetical protein